MMQNKGVKGIKKEDKLLFDKFFKLKNEGNYIEAFKILYNVRDKYQAYYLFWFLLGTVSYLDENYEESANCFNKAVSLNPSHKLSSLGFFHSLFELGKIHSAINEIRRYLLNNSSATKEHKSSLAELYENIKDFSTSERKLIENSYNTFFKN
ncbi:MAG: tetratricopeptide repeat protein [Chitinophagaceae bacterium]|nr:tetratricopeptide repeat protein [Chitinophagaceae bacterium]MCW5927950.1 tetratricopeptide repeat protein [Chitinophagaceae bacterium]